MGEIRIVSPGKTRGIPYPVCKKKDLTSHIRNRQHISSVELLL